MRPHEDEYEEPNAANSVIQEEDDEGALDPDDPYQINRLNDIPHEHLKELYTQVVDELLDIQLDFEEKLADVEEQALLVLGKAEHLERALRHLRLDIDHPRRVQVLGRLGLVIEDIGRRLLLRPTL